MGFIQRFQFANKVASALGPTRKDFRTGGWDGVNLPIWSPDHPLNTNIYAGTGISSDREAIENNFESYVFGAFKANGPVFSCITARQFVFSEATFQWKSVQDGKLFGNPDLSILEKPWPGGTTGELLARMEQDASLAGNSWWCYANDQGDYGNRARDRGTGQRLVRLRPDWTQMVIGQPGKTQPDPMALGATFLGVIYNPQSTGYGQMDGYDSIDRRVLLSADEVVHYAPIPDPTARVRGMSWLTPILREIQADKSATIHKNGFLDNAAVPNMAIKFDVETNLDDIEEFKAKFGSNFQGKWNAYKTMFLMGGADVTPLTHDFRLLDFANVVGKGENRIANAAGVPASWVGFSEGLQGSALNAGNMSASRRRFADGTIRVLWRIAAGSLENILPIPKGAKLWWDETDIAFLREDQIDQAEIVRTEMNAVDSGIKAGYEPDACVDAVYSRDIRKLLGKHTGLVSVQMQPPVDPDNKMDETQGMARIMATQMQFVQAAVAAGFTHESAVTAAAANDIDLLVKDPDAQNWSPTGQALRIPEGQTTPPADSNGSNTPEGGNSGSQGTGPSRNQGRGQGGS